MNATPDLDVLLEPAFRDFRTAVQSAFDIGRRWGRQEAAHEMKAKVAAALGLDNDSPAAEPSPVVSDGVVQEAAKAMEHSPSAARAPRGSVRPAVMGLLAGVLGATQAEIVQQTGMNENSVRGLLNTLRNEGLAEKNGDVWSLTEAGERDVHDPSGSAAQNKNITADGASGADVPLTLEQSSVAMIDRNDPQ